LDIGSLNFEFWFNFGHDGGDLGIAQRWEFWGKDIHS
jgi:hypothetical protein